MAPKKKQEQIDVSTLPQCKSLNAFLFCKGRKARAEAIINKLKEQTNFISSVKKSQVLQHAKEKGIYVDPSSLTDKQKKDAKFMETISTQLTPQILAKSVASYIAQLNIKIRIEKKTMADKPEVERLPPHGRNFDWIYIFEDFPETLHQFQELAKIGKNVSLAFIINPKISWNNAPEIPEPGQQEGEGDQEDEQIVQYRQLQAKEQFTQQDINYQSNIQKQLAALKDARSKSKTTSEFRNTSILQINFDIDPYNENASITAFIKQFIDTVHTASSDYQSFLTWKTDKTSQKIVQQEQNQQNNKQHNAQQPKQADQVRSVPQQRIKSTYQLQGQKTYELLMSLGSRFDSNKDSQNTPQTQQESIVNQINGFQFKKRGKKTIQILPIDKFGKKSVQQFRSQNEILFGQGPINEELRNLLNQLKHPGIKRHHMPQISTKNQSLRKVLRSQYGQFLPKDLSFHEFERRIALLTFEQVLREADEDRNYKLDDRIYQQFHDRDSLIREFYRVMVLSESIVHTKYNEQTDSLLLALVYKNPIRRVNKKSWEGNWKVIPNFQNWLEYFKNNDTNLSNHTFYDIDYEKIGNIEDHSKLYALKDGGIVVSKNVNVANSLQAQLFVIKEHATFGISPGKFFYDNYQLKISHRLNDSQTQETETFLTFKDGKIICVKQNGDVLVYIKGEPTRLHSPQGYTIIYEDNGPKILHPDGGISNPPNFYTNELGKGLKNGEIFEVPTIKRNTQKGEQIIKRDDDTVIVKDQYKKWIRFGDITQYLHQQEEGKSTVVVEKKGFPLFKALKDGSHTTTTLNGVLITGQKNSQGNYDHVVTFKDWSSVQINGSNVFVAEKNLQPNYVFDLIQKQLTTPNDGQQMQIALSGQSSLKRDGKVVNPLEEEQNYNEDDVLPKDHIEPRIFIISNDDTGVELLSQRQLQHYFDVREADPNVSKFEKQINGKTIIQMVGKVQSSEELNAKHIRPQFSINMDIFKVQVQQKKYLPPSYFTLRSFVKYPPLSENDRKVITDICAQTETWRKQNQKQENEYGFCPKNQELLQKKFQSKKQVLNFRKVKQEKLSPAFLRQDSIQQYVSKEKKNKTIALEDGQQFKNKRGTNFNSKESPGYRQIQLVEKGQENMEEFSDERFYAHYFITVEGKKALGGMPDWVFRAKSAKQRKQLDPEIVNELNATMNKTNQRMMEEHKVEEDDRERYDTVELNLSPQKQIVIQPSVFTKRQIDEERYAFQQEKKAYQYHEKKRKDYNLFGEERKNKIEVPSLMRTQPMSEINQKYLVTEAPLDKKVKISSMKNKLTSGSSNMVEMRKEGPHATLIRTLDKKNDYDRLLEKRTMMVHADLNDKLQRDVLINPTEANFGNVQANKTYEIKIEVKNEDIIPQRLIIKKSKTIHVRTQMNQMGPIALGMTRKVSVFLKTSSDNLGRFNDEFDLVTKHQIYHIPVIANVLSDDQFRNTGGLISSKIKEIPNRMLKKNTEELPPI